MAKTWGLLVSTRFCNSMSLSQFLLTDFKLRAFKYTTLNSNAFLCNTPLVLLVCAPLASSVSSYSEFLHEFISSFITFAVVLVNISPPNLFKWTPSWLMHVLSTKPLSMKIQSYNNIRQEKLTVTADHKGNIQMSSTWNVKHLLMWPWCGLTDLSRILNLCPGP